MTKAEAIDYAVEVIPKLFALDSDAIRDICNSILSNSNGDPTAVAQEFLELLGHSDQSYDFIFNFNQMLEDMPAQKPVDVVDNSAAEVERPVVGQPLQAEDTSSEAVTERPSSSRKKSEQKNTRNKLYTLEEVENTLKFLELQGSNANNADSFRCSCQAKIHPLFEVAPNCLSCGKIICCREGLNLNNCTFCGVELMSIKERTEIIELLQQEKKGQASREPVAVPTLKKKEKVFKLINAKGGNMFVEQEKIFDHLEKEKERQRKRKEVLENVGKEVLENVGKDESNVETTANEDKQVDEELAAAQKRLEQLLVFQETGAERMTIIDNASDFSMSNDAGIWGSAYEKAMILKQQQRNYKKWEIMEKERMGRSDKIVLDLTIGKDGKAHLVKAERDLGSAKGSSDDELGGFGDEEYAKDLKEYRELRDKIKQEKAAQANELSKRVWDHENYNAQFKKPIYIGSNNYTEDAATAVAKTTQGRVQLDVNDDAHLEENILAVL